ncbi:unnamed protein product [Phytophthora fragariaefolia]|uniref:Unnamed protein product n=1 Tax=Phytophthora fragariaefolia TaxID=1490495 RepID=A0A9W6Y5X0_9STRA|nr:unnamed protein product [Phytophthora fragariaefolia]
MQPPTPEPSQAGADATVKKRRTPVKKKKGPDEPASVAGAVTISSLLSEPRSPGPYRGKCLYQSRKCENERAIKRNGKPHNLCEEHRSKQNQHQRKFDAKKFSRKRRRGSVSDEDDAKRDKIQPVHSSEEEPAAKHLRTVETETRTPSRVAAPVSAMTGSNQPVHVVAGSTPVLAPIARLPPIQSPHGLIRPLPLPVAVSSSMATEAYPRSHIIYSDLRYTGQQGSHRPYIHQQASQISAGYSPSELVAASVLAQPQTSSSATPTPRPIHYSNQAPVVGAPQGQTLTATPRTLPSLRISPSAAHSQYHRATGIVPSPAQRFAQVVVTPVSRASVSPARTVGTVLPPLVPFGLRRSQTSISSPNSSKK